MKTDIIILSKTQTLLSTALASICKHVDKKSIGKIVVGWTGEEQPAEQDTSMLGFDVTIEALSHYNFAENNNYLVEKHCMSDCVLFMNDDIELVEDSVSKCLKLLENKDVGTVGIKLLYPNGTIQHAGIAVIFNQDRTFRGVTHIGLKQLDMKLPTSIVYGSTGAFLMMRRKDFEEAGKFNEGYVHCFEDVELNLRIMLKGLTNICNNPSWAWHTESATRHQSFCSEDAYKLAQFVNDNTKLLKEMSKR